MQIGRAVSGLGLKKISERIFVQQSGDGLDVGGEGAVDCELGGLGADCGVGFLGEGAGLEGGEKVDALAGAEEFDSEDVAEVGEHALQAAGAAHAHGDVVFLVAAGGDGIDGVRSGEGFIFAGEGGGGDLRDHEAGVEARLGGEEGGEHAGEWVGHLLDAAFGDAAERGDGDGQLVGGHGEGLAVEVAAADDVALRLGGGDFIAAGSFCVDESRVCVAAFAKTSGLSVALFNSTSAMVRAWATESRTAPWTCGVQRRL